MKQKKDLKRTLHFGRFRVYLAVRELENGVTVASIRDPEARGRIIVGVGFRNGPSAEVARRQKGIAHFIEHMVFHGSEEISGAKLSRLVEFSGGKLDGETLRESLFFELVAESWRKAEKLFPIYTRVIRNPRFAREDVTREKHVVITEKCLDRDNPERYAEQVAYQLLFPESPIGSPIDGTLESIRRFTKTGLGRAHNTHCKQPSNIIVVGTGLVQHRKLVKLAQQLVGSLRRRRANNTSRIEEARKSGRIPYSEVRQSNTASHLLVGFNVSTILENDPDFYALSLIASLIASGDVTSLYKLRWRDGIGYDSRIFVEMSRSFATVFIHVRDYRKDKLDVAERAILETIERLKTSRVPLSELRGHVRRLRNEVRENVDTVSELREELFRNILRGKPTRFFPHYKDLRKGVTRKTQQDVQRVTQTYFGDNFVSVRIYGGEPPEILDKPIVPDKAPTD